MGEFEQSIDFHNKALRITREVSDRQLEEANLGSLGRNYYALGVFTRAVEIYDEALSIAREIDDRQGESYQLGSLGTIYREIGKFEKASEFYKDALSIAREIGNRWIEEANLGCLGTVLHRLGKFKHAIQYYQKAIDITLEIGLRWDEALWFGRLGAVYDSLGQFRPAIELYRKGLSIARKICSNWLEGYHLVRLGKAMLTAGNFSRAIEYCQSAQSLNTPRIDYQAVLVLGIALLNQGESSAEASFTHAIARCQSLLDQAETRWLPRYTLTAALVGQAVCDPRWADESQRPELLAPALEEYRRALEITAAPGVVQDAIRDLELIQAAGIEGLEPAFELLENAEYEPDLPEDLPDILEHIKSA
jgi:tetratricopeptide (TPR) repeat protein